MQPRQQPFCASQEKSPFPIGKPRLLRYNPLRFHFFEQVRPHLISVTYRQPLWAPPMQNENDDEPTSFSFLPGFAIGAGIVIVALTGMLFPKGNYIPVIILVGLGLCMRPVLRRLNSRGIWGIVAGLLAAFIPWVVWTILKP